MIATSPGTMKQAPPTSAPARPRSRHAHQIASWVDAGPGSMLVAAIARSNSSSPIQRSRSTHIPRSSDMCAGGPPKPRQPILPQPAATSLSDGMRDEASLTTAEPKPGAPGKRRNAPVAVATVALPPSGRSMNDLLTAWISLHALARRGPPHD
jgi:hypothetical protein